MTDSFNFTWGLPELDGLGFVQVYQFMLRAYAKLGITRQEMLCLIHLASYHYTLPSGESRPSLTTIAYEMGYGDRVPVSRLVRSLEKKGMLLIERRTGQTSIYNARPFAEAAWKMFLEGVAENGTGGCVQNYTGTHRISCRGHPLSSGWGMRHCLLSQLESSSLSML